MTLCLTEIEIAYIAGLFEGEAYFGLDARAKKRYNVSTAPPSAVLRISMIDEDVIENISQLLQKSYWSPSRKTNTRKKVYTLAIQDRATLLYLLPRIFPYLGKRRKEKVKELIQALIDWQSWYEKGGRSEMAKQGALQRKRTYEI